MNWSAWGNVLNQYLRNTSIGTTVNYSPRKKVLGKRSLFMAGGGTEVKCFFLKFHVVCTCTFFGDTICLLTKSENDQDSDSCRLIYIYCIDIWLLTLLFSLQYLSESRFENDNKFLLPNLWVALNIFHLQTNRMFSCEQHCNIVPQYCPHNIAILMGRLLWAICNRREQIASLNSQKICKQSL
jgi:hypothetical protein